MKLSKTQGNTGFIDAEGALFDKPSNEQKTKTTYGRKPLCVDDHEKRMGLKDGGIHTPHSRNHSTNTSGGSNKNANNKSNTTTNSANSYDNPSLNSGNSTS